MCAYILHSSFIIFFNACIKKEIEQPNLYSKYIVLRTNIYIGLANADGRPGRSRERPNCPGPRLAGTAFKKKLILRMQAHINVCECARSARTTK